MQVIDSEQTVGQLVAERPGRSRVFQKLGIDFCCGGKKPLSAAVAEKGLDLPRVLEDLAAEDTRGSDTEVDWTTRSMTELADHIEATHHAYLRAELPRLSAMVDKVARVHGERHAELWLVKNTYDSFQAELQSHMHKEEYILFPAIRRLEAHSGEPCFHCGSIASPIAVMESEHDQAGGALEKFRQLTGGYVPPADACNTYRAMLDGLEQLEADMHQHVHKENNILFPRAIAAEVAAGR